MTGEELNAWLRDYGSAWETRDADLVAALFTEDATYQETPFVEPMRGRAAIRAYWDRAVVRAQEQVQFGYEVLSLGDAVCLARWHASFVRIRTKSAVKLDGVFLLTFDDQRRCQALREWWMKQES